MVLLPFDMLKFIFWSPKAYINKCSIPVRFCKPSWYLDKHYSWSQWELSLNLHCIGLCPLSSNNLHNGVHFQKKSFTGFISTRPSLDGEDRKTENRMLATWRKKGRFGQYWHLGNHGFLAQRSSVKTYTATFIKVCVTLNAQFQWAGCHTGTILYRSAQTSVFRFYSDDKCRVHY